MAHKITDHGITSFAPAEQNSNMPITADDIKQNSTVNTVLGGNNVDAELESTSDSKDHTDYLLVIKDISSYADGASKEQLNIRQNTTKGKIEEATKETTEETATETTKETTEETTAESTKKTTKQTTEETTEKTTERTTTKPTEKTTEKSIEDKCYDAMMRAFERINDAFWSTLNAGSKKHKVIAALICHREGKLPSAIILGTGTIHKDNKECAHDSSCGLNCNRSACDGHAESLVYEGIPGYFKEQMVHLLEEKEMSNSLFEQISSDTEPLKFGLKSGVKFYLIVTEPPCGFIRKNENPCMEWKLPFVGFPHVPTCSSRILIGATMGIQGYVSHLLEKPILIDAVIILRENSEIKSLQNTEFYCTLPLPNIQTKIYDPEKLPNFINQNLTSQGGSKASQINSSASSETGKSKSSAPDGTKNSTLTVSSSYDDVAPSFLCIDIRSGKQNFHTKGFEITDKSIDKSLCIDEKEKLKRISSYKKLFDHLCEKLELKKALSKHNEELEKQMQDKIVEIKEMNTFLSHNTIQAVDKLSQASTLYDLKCDEEKFINESNAAKFKFSKIIELTKGVALDKQMMLSIDDRISDKAEIIVDCSWVCYFRSLNKKLAEDGHRSVQVSRSQASPEDKNQQKHCESDDNINIRTIKYGKFGIASQENEVNNEEVNVRTEFEEEMEQKSQDGTAKLEEKPLLNCDLPGSATAVKAAERMTAAEVLTVQKPISRKKIKKIKKFNVKGEC